MKKYNRTDVAGESWTRANRVVIENGLDELPILKFVEENVTILGDNMLKEPKGVIEKIIDQEQMLEEITIIDPTTGEPTGMTITFQDLYGIIFSVYYQLVEERDYVPPVEEIPAEDEVTNG